MDDEHKEIAKQLLAVDYESEIKWIAKHVISKVESPIVFCNNDVISPNILMRNQILDQINNQNDKKLIDDLLDQLIVIIDFEYCSYNFRGSEIGNYFIEHMFEYNTPEPPHFIVHENKYPDENHKRCFIEEYLSKIKQIKGEFNDIDTVDHILKEVEAYQFGHNLFWIVSGFCYTKYAADDHVDFWVIKSKFLIIILIYYIFILIAIYEKKI